MRLSEQEFTQYNETGFLIREAVFDPAEIAALRDAVHRAEALARSRSSQGKTYHLDGKRFVDDEARGSTLQYEHALGSETLRVIEPIHLFDDAINALVDDQRLALPMQDIIGTQQIALWTAKYNLKSGGGSGFGWHQDSPYWIHDSTHVDLLPNVMVTLDDQDPGNGCFRVVSGSHKQGILPGCNDGTQLGGFFTDPSQFDLDHQVALKVPAGSLIFFNPHIVHGSEPNTSSQPRRAIILTYQPADYPLLKTGQVRNVANQ